MAGELEELGSEIRLAARAVAEAVEVLPPPHAEHRVRIATALQDFGDDPHLTPGPVSPVAGDACAGSREVVEPPSLGRVREQEYAVSTDVSALRAPEPRGKPQHSKHHPSIEGDRHGSCPAARTARHGWNPHCDGRRRADRPIALELEDRDLGRLGRYGQLRIRNPQRCSRRQKRRDVGA
jgi:hypothetical protein